MRVGTGKVEIGQGILTALTQIAAEELDVRPDQIHLVSGQTDVSPAEGFTSGSYSIAVGGASIRLVCAEVRSLFLDRVAETLRLPGRASFRSRTASSCARGKDDRPRLLVDGGRRSSSSGAPPAPRRPSGPSTYRSSASSLPRLDLPAKVTGAAFIHDIAPENVRACAGAAPALARRASRRARRERGAQGRRAPIDILREGDFVAFTATSEIAVMRAADAARTLARWEGGTPAPADIGSPEWLKAQPARDRTVETGQTRPRRKAAWSRRATRVPSSPTARSARPARSPSSRTARSRCGRTARARRCCATGSPGRSASRPSRSPCSTARAPAPTATTPPTTARSTPPLSR